ncbi:MAG: hypothetical protein JO047_17015, partial [Alphaproteobacteria bacterium]|nr:hypothetical protein [Alphaproteobacteria bacterium]
MSATITPLTIFNGSNGSVPDSGLIADAGGDLFGSTTWGGIGNDGSVYSGHGTIFELVKNGDSYTLRDLVKFNGTDGSAPAGPLLMDSSGNLFGTTETGGKHGDGTVFELIKNGTSYHLTTLFSFDSLDGSANGVIADRNGDLFGTTYTGGKYGDGSVFELVKNGSSYMPRTLVNFDGANGSTPDAPLVTDASGDIFGTTNAGGSGNGTVFELVKNGAGYTLRTLVKFDGTNGVPPNSGLMVDSAGNLFGETAGGGANNQGTIFELIKNGGSYRLTTLASFDPTSSGSAPGGGLIADAAGNLFGEQGAGEGSVFELPKDSTSATGYASTPITVYGFSNSPGAYPQGGLIADAAGELFGTAASGGTGFGLVFKLTGTGFVPSTTIYNWKSGISGDWSTSADWSPPGPPTSAADVDIG